MAIFMVWLSLVFTLVRTCDLVYVLEKLQVQLRAWEEDPPATRGASPGTHAACLISLFSLKNNKK
jgi:hypothetical protein